MAVTLISRGFLRSILYRCSQWQQSPIRPLCKGPPDDSSDVDKGIQPVGGDKKLTKALGDVDINLKESVAEETDSDSGSDLPTDNKQEKVQNVEEKLEGPEQMVEVLEDDKKTVKITAEDRRAAAKKKLNDLLISLATTDPVPVEPMSRLELSKPKARVRPKRKPREVQEQTTEPVPLEDIQIEPELVEATKEVAESLGGDIKATESELLSTLRSHAADTSLDEKPTTNLSELFVGMKVERSQSKPVTEHRTHRRHDQEHAVPHDEESRYRKSLSSKPRRPRGLVSVNLFGNHKLGIFDTKMEDDEKSSIGESVLPTWDASHQRELQLSVTHPPANAFVEMVQWTKQGKLWTFPIDNEIGLEEEKKCGFHEHVFLERHLEGWCPKRGPIRHFMELVCTGLSKNPYLTVERKLRHINWYKNYFEEKQEVLKEIGAIEAEQ